MRDGESGDALPLVIDSSLLDVEALRKRESSVFGSVSLTHSHDHLSTGEISSPPLFVTRTPTKPSSQWENGLRPALEEFATMSTRPTSPSTLRLTRLWTSLATMVFMLLVKVRSAAFLPRRRGNKLANARATAVWAVFLWDLHQLLVAKYGFAETLFPPSSSNSTTSEFYSTAYKNPNVPAKGNTLAVQLVVDALKIQPCRPSFQKARDAIVTVRFSLSLPLPLPPFPSLLSLTNPGATLAGRSSPHRRRQLL